MAGFDDATVVRRLGGRSRRSDTLGFGLGEVAALVTPVVWLALHRGCAADRGYRGGQRGRQGEISAAQALPPAGRSRDGSAAEP
ncbi:hypothetical protein ACWD1W_31050 [Streptomyces olivaceoviridis]